MPQKTLIEAQDRFSVNQVVLKTLLMSDLVESTRLVEELGDRRTSQLFARHDHLARDLLARHDGQEIDKTDGFLLLFERPLHAVRYALAYHEALMELSSEAGVELAARVGIHLGEVVLRQNPTEDVARGAKPLEVEGLAKPTAARLMSVAASRQTLLTRGAFDVARRAEAGGDSLGAELRWLAHGTYLFKGVEEPVEIFEVGVDHLSPLTPPGESEKVRRQDHEGILGWRPAPGQVIEARPNWELERKLGEGGFGEVWLALHPKTGDRRVFKFCFDTERLQALKREITLFRLLKEELGDREDIARILDWNFDRVPYFIESEYTAGGSLIDWAQSQGGIEEVPLAGRLELVAQVAEALAAAHSVGVLHKDIKPGNILVHTDRQGRVQARLADFGIGLLTDPTRLADVGITLMGMSRLAGASDAMSAGTQLYHAPELMEGKAATVQADVYALGVMLYQMVVGDLFRALGPGWERLIDDELLRDDIAMAVDVSPQRRLGNALRLGERLRSLDQRRAELEAERREKAEAERARVALERSRRRRRQMAVLIAGLLLFAGAMAFQARRVAREAEIATSEREAAQQVSRFMVDLFEISDPWRNNAITAREILDRGALKIRGELADQPLTQAQLKATIGMVYQKMGLLEPAAPLLEEAFETRSRLAGDGLDLAASCDHLATLYRSQSRYAEAEPLFQQALEIREAVHGPSHPEVADSLRNLAKLLADLNRYDEAEPLYQRALAIREASPVPENLDMSTLLKDMASLYRQQSRYKEADRLYGRALGIVEKLLSPDHPSASQLLYDLALVYADQERYSEAEPLFRRSLEIGEKTLGPNHPNLAANLTNLANLLLDQERFDEAEPLYQRALAIWSATDDPKRARALTFLAGIYQRQGRYAEAGSMYEQSIAIGEEVLGPDHIRVSYPVHGLAKVYGELDRLVEAEALYERALAIREKVLAPGHRDRIKILQDYAVLLRQIGKTALAAKMESRAQREKIDLGGNN